MPFTSIKGSTIDLDKYPLILLTNEEKSISRYSLDQSESLLIICYESLKENSPIQRMTEYKHKLSDPSISIQHGLDQCFRPDGTLISETHYAEGLKEGPELTLAEDGQTIIKQTEFIHGEEVSYKEYDSTGAYLLHEIKFIDRLKSEETYYKNNFPNFKYHYNLFSGKILEIVLFQENTTLPKSKQILKSLPDNSSGTIALIQYQEDGKTPLYKTEFQKDGKTPLYKTEFREDGETPFFKTEYQEDGINPLFITRFNKDSKTPFDKTKYREDGKTPLSITTYREESYGTPLSKIEFLRDGKTIKNIDHFDLDGKKIIEDDIPLLFP